MHGPSLIASKCKCIPPPVAKTQQELRIDYERELAVWQEAVDNWEDNWKRRQDEEWAKLETPGERAAHDLDRFLEHYFSTDGQPDPDKKPEPLALDGITDAQLVADIHTKAATVPGLEIITCGQEADRTICIGWDRAAVCDLASEVQNAARERHRNQMQVEWEAEWEAAMQTHREFVETQHGSQAAPPTFGVPHGTRLGAACGCFVLYCKAIKDMFPNHPRSSRLSMNISHGPGNNDETLRAAVDFGVFHGAAILSCLRPIMDWFVNYYDKTALEAVGRAQSSSSASGLGKRKAEGQVDGERPPQKRKAHELAPHGRVFLRMRGRGGIGDEIFPDIQRGYLDFADSACTKFKGVFDIPGVGEDVEVEGFRVGAHAVVDPPPWTWFWPGAVWPC